MGVCGAPSRVLTWDVCVHACDVSCGVWVPRACVSPLPGQRWGLRVRLGFLLGFLQGCALLFRRKCPLQLLQCSHLSRAHWVGAGCGQWLEGPGGPALAGPEGHETVVGIPMTWKCLGHPCPTHAQSPGRTVPSDHRSRSCRPGRGRPGGEGRRTPSAPAALPSQQCPPAPRTPVCSPSSHRLQTRPAQDERRPVSCASSHHGCHCLGAQVCPRTTHEARGAPEGHQQQHDAAEGVRAGAPRAMRGLATQSLLTFSPLKPGTP